MLTEEVARIERESDRYNPQLIEPLRLLGRIYRDRDEHARAAGTLARATQISRVSSGLHNPAQIQLVHDEIKSLVALGDYEEANHRHEYAFQVAIRAFGSFNPEIVDDVLTLADWYANTGNVFDARRHYIHARNLIVAQAPGAGSTVLLSALRGLARSYRDERFPHYYQRGGHAAGEFSQFYREAGARLADQHTQYQLSVNDFQRGTETLVEIVRWHEQVLSEQQMALLAAEADPIPEAAPAEAEDTDGGTRRDRRRQQRVGPTDSTALSYVIAHEGVDKSGYIDAVVELADWYLLMDKSNRAFALYQHAYKIASDDPRTNAQARFAEPALIYFPSPTLPEVPDEVPATLLKQGYVELQFNVDHRGNPRRMQTAASEPEGMMVFNVRRSMGLARYRPRIVDGLPQPTESITYRHEFPYYARERDDVAANDRS